MFCKINERQDKNIFHLPTSNFKITTITRYCTKHCQYDCRLCLLFNCNVYYYNKVIVLIFLDSLQCPDDYQCGNNSICVVDPLFPKNPVCKCLKGYKMSSDGKCEGTL